MAENALAPEQKLPKAPPVLPDDEVLYELADLFRVFGDSTRIKILYALHDDELCVQDIANAVQLSQSAVSHQLRVLKDSKLVRFRRDGKTIYYALDLARQHPLCSCRSAGWCHSFIKSSLHPFSRISPNSHKIPALSVKT